MNAIKQSFALAFVIFALTGCRAGALDPVDHRPIQDFVNALKSSGQVRIAQGSQDIVATDPGTGQVFAAKSPLMVTTKKETNDWTVSVFHTKIVGSTLLIGTDLQKPTSAEGAALPTFDRKAAEEMIAKMKTNGCGYYPDVVQQLAKSGYKRIFNGKVTFMLNAAPEIAAAQRQQEIDSNILKLNIDGEDIEISQGKLRQIMIDRVKKLKEQRDQLERSNGDANEIARVENLLKIYSANASQGDPAKPDFTAMKPVFADVLFDAATSKFTVLVVDQYGTCVPIATGDGFAGNPLSPK